MEETGEIWEFILEEGLATEEELELVTDLCGMSCKVLSDVIWARTGYRNMQQYAREKVALCN